MLLLSGVSRKDSELVELDAVLEGQPRLLTKAFVRLTIHTTPGVLGVHFVHNLVPLRSRLADDKTMEQLVRLQSLCYCKLPAALEVFLDHGECFPLLILLRLSVAFWGLKEQFQLLPHFN